MIDSLLHRAVSHAGVSAECKGDPGRKSRGKDVERSVRKERGETCESIREKEHQDYDNKASDMHGIKASGKLYDIWERIEHALVP